MNAPAHSAGHQAHPVKLRAYAAGGASRSQVRIHDREGVAEIRRRAAISGSGSPQVLVVRMMPANDKAQPPNWASVVGAIEEIAEDERHQQGMPPARCWHWWRRCRERAVERRAENGEPDGAHGQQIPFVLADDGPVRQRSAAPGNSQNNQHDAPAMVENIGDTWPTAILPAATESPAQNKCGCGPAGDMVLVSMGWKPPDGRQVRSGRCNGSSAR